MKTLLSLLALIPLYLFGQTSMSIEYLPNLNIARHSHQQFAVAPNKFFVVGGHVNGFGLTRNAEIYNANSNTWQLTTANYNHDMGFSAKLNDGKYLIGGGCSSSLGVGQLTNCEVFDPTNNTFTAVASMQVARTNVCAATLTDGRVLVVGNWYASASNAEVYNPSTNSFTLTGACLAARSLPVIIPTNDGGAIVCGGIGIYGGALSRQVFEKYNPVTNSFTELATTLFNGETSWDIACTTPTMTHQFLLPNGKYAVLVYNTAGTLARLISIDPATNAIEEIVTQKPIPLADETDATKKFASARSLMIDQSRNLLHIIQQGGSTSNIVLRIVTINLQTGAVNTMAKDGFDYSVASSNLSMLPDGRILFTGGAKFDNFTLSNRAFIVTPATYPSNDNVCETPFEIHKYFDLAAESGYVKFKASPLGGYVGVAYNNLSDKRQIKMTRLDDKGQILWTKTIRTYPYVYANKDMGLIDADIAADGSLYILSSIYQSWNVSYNEVLHVSATGDSIWNILASSNGEYTKPVYNSIKCFPTGGCVIAGNSNGLPKLQSVRKISKVGEIQWTNTNISADNGYNVIYEASVNKNGEIFLIGKIHNNLNSRASFLVAKVDSLGQNKWDKVFYSGFLNSGDSIRGWGYAIVHTDDGGCIAGGFETDKGTGSGKAVLKKLDADGNLLWQRKVFGYSGSNPAIAYNIVRLNEKDNFVAYGHKISSSTDAQPFLIKFTNSGDSIGVQTGIDRRSSLSGVDKNDNLLFCGYLPMEATGWSSQSYLTRTTRGGIYQVPQLWGGPYDNDKNVSLRPTISWTTINHIGEYKLQIATDSLFSSVVYEAVNNEPTYQFTHHTLITSLLPLTKYFSRIQIVGPDRCPSAWSSIRRFTTMDNTAIDNRKENAFKLYPNPASADIVIELENDFLQNSTLEIFDITGKCIFNNQTNQLTFGNNQFTIDVSKFSNGLYNCKLSNNEEVYSRKFIVNK